MAVRVPLGCAEVFVDHAGDVALEAAQRFSAAFAFGFAALDVGAGGRVQPQAGEGDDVQRAVDLAVASAIEAVADHPARGSRNGSGAGQPCKVRVGAKSLGAGGPADQGGRGQRADARLGDQARAVRADKALEFVLERVDLPRE